MDMLSRLDISNVYLYVADAVRWDFVPDTMLEKGLSIKSISSSIHSPSSFSSIVSGTHPPQHQVQKFEDRLPSDLPNIFQTDSHNTVFVNSINLEIDERPDSVIDKTLNTSVSHHEAIKEIEPPFILVERGPGGHAPYGDFEGTAPEYFKSRQDSPKDRFRQEYSQRVEKRDIRWFKKQLQKLANRELLQDTLVIYTSDHGELLGERGVLGHASPIHPALVYVPTILIHPDLPNEHIQGEVIRHVDILPTIYSLIGYQPQSPIQPSGRDIIKTGLAKIGVCYYNRGIDIPKVDYTLNYNYESAWDYNGGYVISKTKVFDRSLYLFGKLTYGMTRQFNRRKFLENIPFFMEGKRTYGDPKFSNEKAASLLEEIQHLEVGKCQESISVNKQHLRDLGYLED